MAGYQLFCVIGTGGMVATGAVVPLDVLADFYAELMLWLHIKRAIGVFVCCINANVCIRLILVFGEPVRISGKPATLSPKLMMRGGKGCQQHHYLTYQRDLKSPQEEPEVGIDNQAKKREWLVFSRSHSR
jgi:hypothetical protein